MHTSTSSILEHNKSTRQHLSWCMHFASDLMASGEKNAKTSPEEEKKKRKKEGKKENKNKKNKKVNCLI